MFLNYQIHILILFLTKFYLTVCLGASGDIARCLDLARETPRLARKTGHQLERFLLRRANQMVKDEETLSQENCLLLAYELLYLWNALGACLKHSHATIQIGKINNLSLSLIRGENVFCLKDNILCFEQKSNFFLFSNENHL